MLLLPPDFLQFVTTAEYEFQSSLSQSSYAVFPTGYFGHQGVYMSALPYQLKTSVVSVASRNKEAHSSKQQRAAVIVSTARNTATYVLKSVYIRQLQCLQQLKTDTANSNWLPYLVSTVVGYFIASYRSRFYTPPDHLFACYYATWKTATDNTPWNFSSAHKESYFFSQHFSMSYVSKHRMLHPQL